MAAPVQERRRPVAPPLPYGNVFDLAGARIARAVELRRRYRYVQPHIEREAGGWKIVSPNCSRNVEPGGGEIDIAWLVPGSAGTWLLHARDHAQHVWRLAAADLTLDEALARVCTDPKREFWP